MDAPGQGPPPRAWTWLLGGVAAATGAHLAILALDLPVLTRLPSWFWPLHAKPLGPAPLVVATLTLAGAAWLLAWKGPGRSALALAGLFVTGVLLQHGFALLEGRGLDGLRDRMRWTGHAVFARVAVVERDAGAIVANYRELSAAGRLGDLAITKPPGLLLLYVATERAANASVPDAPREERLARTIDLAAFAWPLFSMLTLVPLFVLARRLLRDDLAARAACAMYALAPSAQLMTLHADQAFFPLAAATCLALAVEALHRKSPALGFAAGTCTMTACLLSYGLVALAPLLLSLVIAGARSSEPRSALLVALALAAGIAAVDLTFRAAFGFDFVGGFLHSTAAHASWKGGIWDLREVGYFAFLDLLEFALWVGLPIAGLALLGATGDLRRREDPWRLSLTAGLALTVAMLAVFGRTRAETGRLWLFLAPLCCALAASALARLPRSRRGPILAAALALQWLTVYLTKGHQDFW